MKPFSGLIFIDLSLIEFSQWEFQLLVTLISWSTNLLFFILLVVNCDYQGYFAECQILNISEVW